MLTSRPISPDVPADVVVADPRPRGLLERLRAAGLTRGAFLLGDGVPFSLYGSPQRRLELEEHHAFPDGTIRHVYRVAG